MRTVLSNGPVRLEIDSLGAELCSIRYSGNEYLWQADPAFWNRHSPVLFPIVGRVWENVFRVDGKEYSLGQHGFARDMEFELVEAGEEEAWYRLEASEQTLEKYPFRFVLEIGYRLRDRKIDVMWRVRNPGSERLPFQIGAHPAFLYPEFCADDAVHGYFRLGKADGFRYILIKEKGCVDVGTRYEMLLPQDALMPLDAHTFDSDAFVVEDGQIGEVTLCGKDRRPWLTVRFDTPVVGLWSPPGKNAPFVCIEPWYGRCDRVGYDGEFSGKDWMMGVGAGECFEGGYSIEVE